MPQNIAAFHMSEEVYDDNTSWPSWLREANDMDRQNHGSIYRSYGRKLLVRNGDKLINLPINDWLVQDDAGTLHIISPENFTALFA